ncbi:MAG: DNA pilot protein [Arizlama microvirus]|nr:MAG: DNA pilot protein [Arizlama microvirus]
MTGLEILGAGAAAVGSGFLGSDMRKGETEWNKEQDLDKARKMPSAQVFGLKAAGLNPMLAAAGGFASGGGVTPSSANFSAANEYANISNSLSSAQQADTAATQTASNVKMQEQQTRKLMADAGISFETERQLTALTHAMMRKGGAHVLIEGSGQEALTAFMQSARVDREVQAAAAEMAEKSNMEELQKFLNMPAANALMQALQLAVRLFVMRK